MLHHGPRNCLGYLPIKSDLMNLLKWLFVMPWLIKTSRWYFLTQPSEWFCFPFMYITTGVDQRVFCLLKLFLLTLICWLSPKVFLSLCDQLSEEDYEESWAFCPSFKWHLYNEKIINDIKKDTWEFIILIIFLSCHYPSLLPFS